MDLKREVNVEEKNHGEERGARLRRPIGVVRGTSVWVSDDEDGRFLRQSTNGFGSGSLSRGYPLVGARGGEHLQLSLWEAFYAAFDANVMRLNASDGVGLTEEQAWTRFSSLSPRFQYMYAVVARYRRAGWAPRSGVKYGSDFVLYRILPAKQALRHRHGPYGVIVIPEQEGSSVRLGSDWFVLQRRMRLIATVRKTMVLCRVTCPEKPVASAAEARTTFLIHEIVMGRWPCLANEPLGKEASGVQAS